MEAGRQKHFMEEAADEIERLAALSSTPQGGAEPVALRIVLDGPPSHDGGRFVEIEDANGKSFNAGEWKQRTDGLWELRVGARHLAAHPVGEPPAVAAPQPNEWETKFRKALEEIRRIPVMPFPDAGAHGAQTFGEAVWTAWSRIQQIATKALYQAPGEFVPPSTDRPDSLLPHSSLLRKAVKSGGKS